MPARFVQKYQIERDVPIKKNVVMNGDFAIWQRGTSFAGLSGVSFRYVADRWAFGTTNSGTWTVSRNGDVPSNNEAFSINMECTVGDGTVNAGDNVGITHFIEGYNYKSLYQRFQVLSFWVKSSIIGAYHASLRNAGPGISDRSYVMPFTINVANTWERKELIVENPISSGGTWNFTNGLGAYLSFVFVCGLTFQTPTPNQWIVGNFVATNAQTNLAGAPAVPTRYIRFAGVQLEEGQIATPFQFVTIDEELARCQRYYEKSYDVDVTPGTITNNGVMVEVSSGVNPGTAAHTWHFLVRKRISPTVITFNPLSGTVGTARTAPPVNTDVPYVAGNMGTATILLTNPGSTTDLVQHACHATADAELS